MSVLLDAMDHLPAGVFNGRLDVLAVTALGRALYAPVLDLPGRPDSARFLFLDEPAASTPSPGSCSPSAPPARLPEADAIRLLASWNADDRAADRVGGTDA